MLIVVQLLRGHEVWPVGRAINGFSMTVFISVMYSKSLMKAMPVSHKQVVHLQICMRSPFLVQLLHSACI